MAKKRKSTRPQKTTKSGGGTMTGMRSGFQSIVGTKKTAVYLALVVGFSLSTAEAGKGHCWEDT